MYVQDSRQRIYYRRMSLRVGVSRRIYRPVSPRGPGFPPPGQIKWRADVGLGTILRTRLRANVALHV